MRIGDGPAAVIGDENGIFATDGHLPIGKAPGLGGTESQKTCLNNDVLRFAEPSAARASVEKKGYPRTDCYRFGDFFCMGKRLVPLGSPINPYRLPDNDSWQG